jgi:IclR family transcriptional regulator, KDG regulon repressor
VDKVDSVHAVRAYIGIGDRAPAYCTATGKAILAFLPADVSGRIAKTMKRYTPNTITDPRKLKAELALIRERGYAVTGGEWRPGVFGIAAPVKSPSGVVVAGVGIAGPEERMREVAIEEWATAVMGTAERISQELGFAEIRPDRAKTPTPKRASGPRKRKA